MSAVIVMKDMTATEARECVSSIKGSIGDLRSMLSDLRDRKGWKALGYKSFQECISLELGISRSKAYYLLTAQQISEIVHNCGQMPEAHTRELAPLARSEPEKAREIMDDLKAEKGDAYTARDIRERVKMAANGEIIPTTTSIVNARDRSAENQEVAQQVQALKDAWDVACDRARAQFLSWTRGL